MRLIPKNWRDFQHYKERNPPWIRLHKALLDNYEFQCLPDASRALAPMLWLIASDFQDGVIDADLPKLAFRLRRTEQEIADALKPLIDNGFFVVEQDASGVLASCKQSAVPEALQRHYITEAEGESPQAASPPPKPVKKSKPTKTPMPDGFGVSEWVRDWAKEKGFDRLSDHLDAFRLKAKANSYAYADWDAAFMNAIRDDWAKLRQPQAPPFGKPDPAKTVPSNAAELTAAAMRETHKPLTQAQREAANKARELAMNSIKRVAA